MTSNDTALLRQSLLDAMTGHQAHLDFAAAIADVPPALRDKKPDAAPHTAWQLLEHLRIAQHDILEFSRNAEHKSPKWPEEYWPKTEAPPTPGAWDQSIAQYKKDAAEMVALIDDPKSNLTEPFKHGDGQTLLREALLVANHNSYHLGELVFLKKQLLADK